MNYLQTFENFHNTLDYVFWDYLIHYVNNEEDAQNIIENGFRVSQNPNIVSGLYTVPNNWHDPQVDKGLKNGGYFKIYTKPQCKVWDGGNERAGEQTKGLGREEYKLFFASVLRELGYNPKLEDGIIVHDSDYSDIFLKYYKNWEHRKVWASKLTKWLLDKGVDLYVNGGELILLNLNMIEDAEYIKK